MSIIGKRVFIENQNSTTYKAWVSCGLPESVIQAKHLFARADSKLFKAYAIGKELFVQATVPPRTKLRCVIEDNPNTVNERFELAEWVSDEIHKLIPIFKIRENGVTYESNPIVPKVSNVPIPDFIELYESNYARLTYKFRTRIAHANITIDGFFYVYWGQEVIEWKINATYGTVEPNQPRDRVFGSFSMVIGELPVIDFRIPKGLHEPIWFTDPVDQYSGILWEAELATPRQWNRAKTIENMGALLCLPPANRFAQVANDPRVKNMIARLQFPLTSIFEGWSGNYGVFGKIPTTFPGAVGELNSRYNRYLDLLVTPGDEDDSRRYGQPSNSGQTGEQADFGVARAEHAMMMLEPWAIHDLRYHVQAWKLRPYANKEVDGSPVRAINHPNTKTYNLRPDERFSSRDMLGWPNPVGWISGWLTSDSQHRSDNLLFDLYSLTRCHSLEMTIRDIIELERMAYDPGEPNLGVGLGAPRGWGRVLFSWCKGYKVGFAEFEPMIRKMVSNAYRAASFRKLSTNAKVRVLSDGEEKYGWFKEGTTTPIRCWLPWQESIAVIGFYAAWKVLGIPEAKELVLAAAKTITSYGFYKEGNEWLTAYGVRWREDALGEPLPATSYTSRNPNYDVYTYGMHRWTLPAVKILLDLEPNCPEAARATEINNFFGVPKGFDDVCWWAI